MLDPTLDPSANQQQPTGNSAPAFNPLALLNGPNFINPAYATPEQRAQLYAYSKALMEPQPIKNGWQGIAAIARSLVGGYAGYQADQMERGANQAAMSAYDELLNRAGMPNAASQPYSGANLPSNGGGPTPLPNTPPAGSTAAIPNEADATYSRMIGEESGGHQFAANGTPLTSPKGAIGIAQVMPSTGPEAAGYAGLPWDAQRFAQDKDYNLALGDAYYKHQLNTYGSPDKAAAAYNAGPAAIDHAIAMADKNGGSYLDYLPKETQAYVANAVRGNAPAAAAINNAAPAPAPGAGGPIRVAQASGIPGIPPGLAGFVVANPNLPVELRAMAAHLIGPQIVKDVNGNEYVSRNLQAPETGPRFQGGRTFDYEGIPGTVYGPPANPHYTMAPPTFAGGASGGPAQSSSANAPTVGTGASGPTPQAATPAVPDIAGPDSVRGQIAAQKAATAAHVAAIGQSASASTDQYNKDRLTASNFQSASLPLTKAIPLLEQLGTTGTGPGSDTWNHAMSFFQTMGIPISDPNNIKAFDEVKKYLTDNVNQNGDHSTNDKMAAAFAGNPSVEVSNAAASDVAKTALSMMRFRNAAYLSYAKQPGAMPEGYADYVSSKYAQQYDPRAFGFDLMTKQAKQALYAQLAKDPAARAKFVASLQVAKDTGMIPPPQAPQ